ncbi:MAG TPA: tetratricopeptide repeat protein, partial [Candidatus Hydrogenedentes bacterium]|nr:tetratricopeptide repeat protein [Candidatus Hydrogenedentota bacterium]
LATNFMLLWTHPFATLLLLVEATFLAIWQRSELRRTVTWFIAHAALAIPSVVYLLSIQFWPKQQTEAWFQLPSFLQFLGDVFADDVITATYQLRISDTPWAYLGGGTDSLLAALRPAFDIALAALPCIAILWLGVCAYRGGHGRTPATQSHAAPAKNACALLVLWLVLPPMLLYIASLVWRPCVFPRYTLHCSLAAYLLIGGAMGAIRHVHLKTAAACAVCILYAYQAALVHPGPQRTDWQSAARYIQTSGTPNDVVLVQVSIWRDVFAFNMGETEHLTASAETLPVVADLAAFAVERFQPPAELKPNQRNVWVVIATPYFGSGPNEEFERHAASFGLDASLTEFSGIKHLLVYRVTKADSAPTAQPERVADHIPDCVEGYGNLAMAFAEAGEYDMASQALDILLDINPAAARMYGILNDAVRNRRNVADVCAAVRAFRKGQGHRENRQYGFAVAEFRNAVRRAPHYPAAHAELGVVLARLGKHDRASAALRRAIHRNPATKTLYSGLLHALERNTRVPEAVKAVRVLEEGFACKAQGKMQEAIVAFREATELDPGCSGAWHALGSILIDQRDHAAATPVFRHIAAQGGRESLLYSRLAAILEQGGDAATTAEAINTALRGVERLGTGNPEEAARLLEQAVALDPALGFAHFGLAAVRFATGDEEGGAHALRTAIEVDPAAAHLLGPLYHALFTDRNSQAARTQLEQLANLGIVVPYSIAQMVGR